VADKVLDAPEIINDYYLNVMDWSKLNIIAIALGPQVYTWNASSGSITHLCRVHEDDAVTSLSWSSDGRFLSIGTHKTDIQLWDIAQIKQVRTMSGHIGRVSTLAWNECIISSAGRDSKIMNHDVRQAKHLIQTLEGHCSEVCALKWSNDGKYLASGANDNLLNIWESRQNTSYASLAHHAAVKAIAWNPHSPHLLASGAGAADRHLRIWNANTGALLNCIDTQSQVCSVLWSKHTSELISSHGFSRNNITMWLYPTLTRAGEINGHTNRVLYMCLSPDGTTIASASADETLRFWKVFDISKNMTKLKQIDENSWKSIAPALR